MERTSIDRWQAMQARAEERARREASRQAREQVREAWQASKLKRRGAARFGFVATLAWLAWKVVGIVADGAVAGM